MSDAAIRAKVSIMRQKTYNSQRKERGAVMFVAGFRLR